MNISVIIPVHNEEETIAKTLSSLLSQSLFPNEIIVVDDNSTDNTKSIVNQIVAETSKVRYIYHASTPEHQPGGKIVKAFLKGLELANPNYDIMCKFDADLIFPPNYLEIMADQFSASPQLGMFGGICTVEKNGHWIKESVTGANHLRGALKAYRRGCYEDIGGIKPVFGWDTIDELLAEFHGWSYRIDESLKVKHLKPTASRYLKSRGEPQGRVLYGMRMGPVLTTIRAIIQSFRKRKISYFGQILKGYKLAKHEKMPLLVSKEAGMFIRRRQWGIIRKKAFRF
ncbi:MAG: glycosyltransferase family 2 protein [Flavobacteriaceae bacterium]|nr:glycosyltransferase family 2 protein [Flavobacteriaceae bacterium]